jgi:TPR repeat protein
MKRASSTVAALVLLLATRIASAACQRDDHIVPWLPLVPVLESQQRIRTPEGDGALKIKVSVREGHENSRDAINRLGIQYARGRGVSKNYKLAFKLFKQLAMDGYTPGMVNLGTLYEWPGTGWQDHRRAYAWIRAALSVGVEESDYDSTVLKLAIIAGKMGMVKLVDAERLATRITVDIIDRCGSSTDRYGDISAWSEVP